MSDNKDIIIQTKKIAILNAIKHYEYNNFKKLIQDSNKSDLIEYLKIAIEFGDFRLLNIILDTGAEITSDIMIRAKELCMIRISKLVKSSTSTQIEEIIKIIEQADRNCIDSDSVISSLPPHLSDYANLELLDSIWYLGQSEIYFYLSLKKYHKN